MNDTGVLGVTAVDIVPVVQSTVAPSTVMDVNVKSSPPLFLNSITIPEFEPPAPVSAWMF
ncbi:hypothetical protein FJZ21_03170 [Candidatus Pacearchaeota archaeon]|nr:hypothetical protein [Candidatus Pacearchaeota archaeon]